MQNPSPIHHLILSKAPNPIYDLALFDSIHHVDPHAWDAIVHSRSLFLQRRYLACIESAPDTHLVSRYALFTHAKQPVGAAVFQITDFVRKTTEAENVDDALPLTKRLLLAAQPSQLPLVVCGSSFHTGENGFAFLPDSNPLSATDCLVHAVEQLQEKADGSRKPSGALFKEFGDTNGPIARHLTHHAFHALDTDPVMVLGVDPTWTSFSDYLSSLTSKYRVKARRAYEKSTALVSRDLDPSDLDRLRPRMQQLYDAVIDRADYRLARFDMATLAPLHDKIGESFIVRGYFLGDNLVGFMTGFHVASVLEAHLVGIDYEVNREHSTYPRMLYDYLQIALDRRAAGVNYGRTATEIKSSLGAVPVDMKCYVRHRSPTLNKLLPLAVRAIRPPGMSLRKPFKKVWYEMHGDGLAEPSRVSPASMAPVMG